ASVHQRRRLDYQRQRRRVVAEVVVVLEQTAGVGLLVVERIEGLAGDRVVLRHPVLGPAHHLANERDEDLALITALQTELTAQVAELAELAAGEARQTAADAQVDVALELSADLQSGHALHARATKGAAGRAAQSTQATAQST